VFQANRDANSAAAASKLRPPIHPMQALPDAQGKLIGTGRVRPRLRGRSFGNIDSRMSKGLSQ